MNNFHVPFRVHFRPKLFSQILHLCGLRFSWTVSMCLLICACSKAEKSHKTHLKGFLFSWTLSKCSFSVLFWSYFFWQILHWCGLRFSWTHSMCLLRSLCRQVEKSHNSHLKSLLFPCTDCTWLFRFSFRLKLWWQILHWCSLSFSWTYSMCLLTCTCVKAE